MSPRSVRRRLDAWLVERVRPPGGRACATRPSPSSAARPGRDLGPALQARPERGRLGLGRGVEEAAVLALGRAHAADRPAVDAGRRDADEQWPSKRASRASHGPGRRRRRRAAWQRLWPAATVDSPFSDMSRRAAPPSSEHCDGGSMNLVAAIGINLRMEVALFRTFPVRGRRGLLPSAVPMRPTWRSSNALPRATCAPSKRCTAPTTRDSTRFLDPHDGAGPSWSRGGVERHDVRRLEPRGHLQRPVQGVDLDLRDRLSQGVEGAAAPGRSARRPTTPPIASRRASQAPSSAPTRGETARRAGRARSKALSVEQRAVVELAYFHGCRLPPRSRRSSTARSIP